MRICIVTSSAKYRMGGHSQNFLIFGILIVLKIEKFWKFVKFPVEKISWNSYKGKVANVSNLKNNKLSNVEQPNFGVTEVENKNWDDKASKFIYIKGKICEFLISKLKNSANLFIFQLRKFHEISIQKIRKSQFGK